MAIFYKLRYRNNTTNPNYSGFYATVSNKGTVSTDEVAEEIQRNCSMKRSDVLAVLAELSEVMKQQIQQSHSVKLNGIGIFRPGIRSVIAKTPDMFKPSNIKGLRLNFLPEGFRQGKQLVKAVFTGAKIMQEGVPATVKPGGSVSPTDKGGGSHQVSGGDGF